MSITRKAMAVAVAITLGAGSASAGVTATGGALKIGGQSVTGTMVAQAAAVGAGIVLAGYLAWNTLVPAGKMACSIATNRVCGS